MITTIWSRPFLCSSCVCVYVLCLLFSHFKHLLVENKSRLPTVKLSGREKLPRMKLKTKNRWRKREREAKKRRKKYEENTIKLRMSNFSFGKAQTSCDLLYYYFNFFLALLCRCLIRFGVGLNVGHNERSSRCKYMMVFVYAFTWWSSDSHLVFAL